MSTWQGVKGHVCLTGLGGGNHLSSERQFCNEEKIGHYTVHQVTLKSRVDIPVCQIKFPSRFSFQGEGTASYAAVPDSLLDVQLTT